MRVLLICSFYDNFVEQLYTYLMKYYSDIEFSILTSHKASKEYIELADDKVFFPVEDNYIGYRKLLAGLPQFDIVQMLWIEPLWGIFIGEIAKRTNSVYISVGGSDLYRDSKSRIIRFLQKKILSYADCVSSENTQTMEFFKKRYGKKYSMIPHHIARFGVDVFDNIDSVGFRLNKEQIKEKWRIGSDKMVIMLGHNGRKQHNHLRMIEAIDRLDKDDKDKLAVIIPMTYGTPNEEYLMKVETAIKKVGVDYHVPTEYMNNDQMAELAIMTDIMVHVQDTDQLSSTMLSCMYAGSYVIAGSWLPYDSLKEAGIYFEYVNGFEELTLKIMNAIHNKCYVTECMGNRDKVRILSSWKNCAKVWHDIYASLYYKRNES